MKTIIMGIFLAAAAGCAMRPSVYPIHISSLGHQDVDIRCLGPRDPIKIISKYCNDDDAPLVMSNGNVVLFLTDNQIQMIGWDKEDLSSGGQVFVSKQLLAGRTTDTARWWRTLADQDSRFSLIVTDTK